MTKCLGCGAKLQDKNPNEEGYTSNLDNKYCERCFRITHYNEYIFSDKSNDEYLRKIEYINKTGDLVLLTLDFLNLFEIDTLNINNPVLLLFTKKDLLPRSVHESKFLNSINSSLNIKDKMFISSKNNYNLDLLMEKIYKYKKSKNVYVVGLTNSGKSTLINKILKNYSLDEGNITTSNLPSTTLDFLEKDINDELTLIDTPGLLDDGNIIMELDKDIIKKIIPKKEINPIIYQIKCDQSIFIEEIVRLDIPKDNNIIMYISNSLKIDRVYKDSDRLSSLEKHSVHILDNQDLVIKGLGFIKFKKECIINLYLGKNVNYYVRNSIV